MLNKSIIDMIHRLVRAGSPWYRASSWLVLSALLLGLTACAATSSEGRPGAIPRTATVVLPTSVPKANPTPTSTRVVPATVFTPGPTPTITPIPDIVRALVVNIIAGDTIEVVMDGDPQARTYKVRYLGIEAPPNSPSVPWGVVAFETNLRLTNGKVVRLERDQSEADEEGRLLRYVFVGDKLLSVTLTEQGLARARVTEPDTRFKAEILEAESQAKRAEAGVWGPPPTPTPKPILTQKATLTTTVKVTVEPEATAVQTPASDPSTPVETEEPPPAETPTPAATSEPTPTTQTGNPDLQGPQ